MLAHLLVALLQITPVPAPKAQAPERDSTTGTHRPKREAKRIPVTPEHLATAYHDEATKSLLLLARAARMRQDSALLGYDATTLQRISAGLGFAKLGRDRLAFRSEQATHVRWRRGIGAYVDVTGSRVVVPIAGTSATVRMDGDISPVPYYPGSETIWIGASAARQAVDENQGVVNPLAEGAEAYYIFDIGDSATFRLPDGKAIRLRELKVRPRTPRWNLAVGSLWFDLSGGQLVRAAYRMSVPMDLRTVSEENDSSSFKDVPALMKPMLFPMTASISAIGVEYGLYQGRFWLPRLQVLEGGMNVGFMHSPFKLEQKFTYENVNSGAPLAPIAVSPERARGNGVEVGVMVGEPGKGDVERETRRNRRMAVQCDSTGNRTYTRRPEGNPNPVITIIPCDSLKLANSPDLPPSIYDKGEETFNASEMDALVAQALSMNAQPEFAPRPPALALDNFRYNRIEGLSVGAHVDQQLGAGYALYGGARIGFADLDPNLVVTGSRSDLRRTLSLSAYHRLESASDWGNPLSLGSSISAFLFGRDEGFYYRASGIELTSTPDDAAHGGLTWTLFADHENTASPQTTFSLARVIHGSAFERNFVATEGPFVGARTRMTNTLGDDPQAFRLFSDVRLEAGLRESTSYGRAAADVTASHGIGNGALSLTLAGGSSVGELPTQRFWFLGGTQTIRGNRPGTEVGNAFWMGRIEAALGNSIVRPVAFADIGWAGSRNNLGNIGLPMSGAGFGWSMMDGLVRFDVAHGINPRPTQWRIDMYVEGRF